MFDARLLTSFVAVAEFKHFGKAAAAVNATQPGISQHLAKLERQLGFKLVERTKRSVMLTPAGETFLGHAKYVIGRMHKMQEEGQQIAKGLRGQVSLGFSSSVLYSEIPRRISAFRDRTPNVELLLKVQGGNYLKGMLDVGEIDVAVTTLPMDPEEYHAIVIAHQAMGIAVPTGHPLAKRKTISIKALRAESFIAVPRDQHPELHDTMVAKFHQMGVPFKVVAYETPFLNALARVAVGEGVALVAMGYRSERDDAVHILNLRDEDLSTTPIYAVARRDNARPTTERLMEALAKP